MAYANTYRKSHLLLRSLLTTENSRITVLIGGERQETEKRGFPKTEIIILLF